MIGPVSGTGRAMMASLQQAIEKGMPPDQAIQYVKSMATQGVAPLTDLYSMLNQFQRLKQQQVKPPQTPPTIRDQLNILDQQQRMQPQQGNIQQMQAGAPAPQPMDRGLGAIDAGRMEYPQFADGGIVSGVVAFDNGGTADSAFSNLGESVSGYFGDIFRGFSGAAPGGEPFQTQEMYALSADPTLTDEKIVAAYREAVAKGDPKANEYRKILINRNLGEVVERTNRELARNKPISLSQATTKLGQELGLKDKPPVTPPPAGVKPPGGTGGQRPPGGMQLGGGDYGDFSRGRQILTDIGTQLKPEAEKTLEQRLAEMDAIQAKQGIGESARKRGEYLTKREAEGEKDLASDKRMALAQAGFAMAEAASRRGRERTGFLGAAAIGGTTGTKLYQAALKENRALKDSIAQNRFALEQADELRKMGNIRDANALEKEAKSNLRSLNLARAQNETAIAEFQGRERGQDRRTAAEIAAVRERYAAASALKNKELLADLIQGGYLTGDSDQAKQLRSLVMNNLGVDVGDQVQIDLAKYGQ